MVQKLKKYLAIGFSFFVIFVFNSCEKEVSVTPVSDIPPQGFIYLDSNPQGAKIYLDDKNTGKVTPDSIRWLPENVYKLTLKHPSGYRDTVFYIDVKENARKEAFVNYLISPGMRGHIWCTTVPDGSEIILNGVPTGRITPDTLKNLLPGEYSVKYTKYGYWGDSASIKVTSGRLLRVHKVLTDTSLWITYNRNNSGVELKEPYDVEIDASGRIWVATHEHGLMVRENNKWRVFDITNSPLPENFIKKIAVDHEQNIWVGTNASGLLKFNGSGWIQFTEANSPLPGNHITDIVVAPDGKIWVAAYNAGIGCFDGSSWTLYNMSNSKLKSDFINCLAFDSDGNLWAGTYNAGLMKLDGTLWRNFQKPMYAFPHNNITSIAVDASGLVWLGFGIEGGVATGGKPGGMASFDGTQVVRVSPLQSFTINDIRIDNNGTKWVATGEGGLAKVRSTGVVFNKSNSSIPSNTITSVALDKEGNKWLGATLGGLVKYKGK